MILNLEKKVCEFWGFHIGVAERFILLGYDAASEGSDYPLMQQDIPEKQDI